MQVTGQVEKKSNLLWRTLIGISKRIHIWISQNQTKLNTKMEIDGLLRKRFLTCIPGKKWCPRCKAHAESVQTEQNQFALPYDFGCSYMILFND